MSLLSVHDCSRLLEMKKPASTRDASFFTKRCAVDTGQVGPEEPRSEDQGSSEPQVSECREPSYSRKNEGTAQLESQKTHQP